MTLEAERWLREPFPVGRLDDTPTEAAKRRGWCVISGRANRIEAVAESGELHVITQTNAGPRAQRTT